MREEAVEAPARSTAEGVAQGSPVAEVAPDRAAAILRDLFVTVDERDLLVRVARSLSRVGDGPTPLPKLVAAPTELAEHPVRWSALLAAGHPEAQRRVLVTLQDDAPTAARRSALKAWRMAAVLAPPKSAPPALLRALR